MVSILKNESYDLIVTDTLATTLLECLATQSRVIMSYDPDIMKFYPGVLDKMQNRAEVTTSQEEFTSRVALALTQKQRPGPVNDDFLMSYALKGEAKPIDLQVEAIANIVAQGR